MVSKLLGQKKGMSQVWTEAGQRWPVTQVVMADNAVVRAVSSSKDEETAHYQIAFGNKKMKNMAAATASQLKKAKIQDGKRKFIETSAQQELQPGTIIRVEDVFSPGEVVKVTGHTKGRGFTGVMKRWGFAGGQRTHGQSDRERAPGSIGAGTTPGRVWKGKKMAGRSGNQQQTIEDCVIVAVDAAKQSIWIRGTLPGSYNGFIQVTKQNETVEVKLHEHAKELLNLQPAEDKKEDKKSEVKDKADSTQKEETKK